MNTITRVVYPDAELSPHDLLKSIGFRDVDGCWFREGPSELMDSVMKTMPTCRVKKGKAVEVVFFHITHNLWSMDLPEEYRRRGLVICDAHSLVKVNQDDPQFGVAYPNAICWRIGREYRSIEFCRPLASEDKDATPCITDYDGQWDDFWWLAGIRK